MTTAYIVADYDETKSVHTTIESAKNWAEAYVTAEARRGYYGPELKTVSQLQLEWERGTLRLYRPSRLRRNAGVWVWDETSVHIEEMDLDEKFSEGENE